MEILSTTQSALNSNKQAINNTSNNQEESFGNVLANKQEEETKFVTSNEAKKNKQEIVDNLFSVIKTGLTKEDLEYLEELLKEIKKLNDEKNTKSRSSEEKTKDLIAQLELALMKIQKKLNGVGILKLEDDKSLNNIKSENPDMSEVDLKIKALELSIDSIKNAAEKKSNFIANHDELKLVSDLKKDKLL